MVLLQNRLVREKKSATQSGGRPREERHNEPFGSDRALGRKGTPFNKKGEEGTNMASNRVGAKK